MRTQEIRVSRGYHQMFDDVLTIIRSMKLHIINAAVLLISITNSTTLYTSKSEIETRSGHVEAHAAGWLYDTL